MYQHIRLKVSHLSLSCSHSLIWSVMVGGMWADILLVDIMCMLRNLMIWLAVMPPLRIEVSWSDYCIEDYT